MSEAKGGDGNDGKGRSVPTPETAPKNEKPLRSALQRLTAKDDETDGPKSNTVEEEELRPDDAWRKIITASARACTTQATRHEQEAKTFLKWGWVVATLGLLVFLAVVGVYEWAAAWTSGRAVSILGPQASSHESRMESIEQLTDAEEKRKFSLIEWQTEAKKGISDPAQLKRFETTGAEVVKAIETSEQHRRSDLERFHRDVVILNRLIEGEEHFRWHRDLLPILRSVSILFFIEVLAGFLFSLARKKEALALHWRKERRSCERILALPGALEEIKKAKIPITDAITATLTAATPESNGDANDENPMLDALRSALAIAERQAKAGKAD